MAGAFCPVGCFDKNHHRPGCFLHYRIMMYTSFGGSIKEPTVVTETGGDLIDGNAFLLFDTCISDGLIFWGLWWCLNWAWNAFLPNSSLDPEWIRLMSWWQRWHVVLYGLINYYYGFDIIGGDLTFIICLFVCRQPHHDRDRVHGQRITGYVSQGQFEFMNQTSVCEVSFAVCCCLFFVFQTRKSAANN